MLRRAARRPPSSLLAGQRREELRLAARLQPLAARVEVDLPAGELRREAHVLAVAPDGQRELVLVHDRLDRLATSASLNTRATLAGASASLAKRSGSGDHGTMSMRSPPSSFTTACTREPLRPTHAPTGSIESSREKTAIFVRLPTSRAAARISTMPCWISGTSSLNSACTNSGSARLRIRRGPFGRLLDALEHGADRLALMEVLAMVLLAVRDDRLRLAELVEHDHELAALDLLDLAGEQLADARRRTRRGSWCARLRGRAG